MYIYIDANVHRYTLSVESIYEAYKKILNRNFENEPAVDKTDDPPTLYLLSRKARTQTRRGIYRDGRENGRGDGITREHSARSLARIPCQFARAPSRFALSLIDSHEFTE